MTNKRIIDVDTTDRADGKGPVWDTASGTHVYVASSGSVAADTIWDAAGDLAVGTGANTAAKLSIGATDGMAVQRVSGAVAWALPPGYEYDYVEKTSSTNLTATTEATANTIVTANAVTFDGSPVIVEFFTYDVRTDTTAASRIATIFLYMDGSSIGFWATIKNSVNGIEQRWSGTLRRRLSPSAGSHTFSVRGTTNAGTAVCDAGAGGSGVVLPTYIRITKA